MPSLNSSPRLLIGCLVIPTILAGSALTGCWSALESDDALEATSEVNSSSADDAAFDAIGAIEIRGYRERPLDDTTGCTGVLVAPNLVLSTRRCEVEESAWSDATTARAFHVTRHVTTAAGTRVERSEHAIVGKITTGRDGGLATPLDGAGRDAAFYILKEPVVGVTPLALRAQPLATGDEGRTFVMVGYGASADTTTGQVPRTKGPATVDAVTGRPYTRAFGTESAFRSYVASINSPTFAARLDFDRSLDDDAYEAHAGLAKGAMAPGNADTCRSARHVGAPLLERVGDHYEVVAIVTGGERYKEQGQWPTAMVEPKEYACRVGTFLTKMGPELQRVLARASADPSSPTTWACGEANVANRGFDGCQGNVRVECSRSTTRLHVEDCSAHGSDFACVQGVEKSPGFDARPTHCGHGTIAGPPPAFDTAPSVIKNITTRFEQARVDGIEPSKIPGVDFRPVPPSTCALFGSGELRCWGKPYDAVDARGKLVLNDGVKLVEGTRGNYALRASGRVVYWGSDQGGTERLGSNLMDVGVSGGIDMSRSCVVRANGTVACWNDDTLYARFVAADIAGITNAVEVTGTKALGCARSATGSVSCWSNGGPAEPTTITDAIAVEAAVQLSQKKQACAVRAGGRVTCWESGKAPFDVEGIDDAVKLYASLSSWCAVRTGGLVSCWGSIYYGTFGASYAMPVAIQELDGVSALSISPAQTATFCAHTKKGHALSCWGGRDEMIPLFPHTMDTYYAPHVVYDDSL